VVTARLKKRILLSSKEGRYGQLGDDLRKLSQGLAFIHSSMLAYLGDDIVLRVNRWAELEETPVCAPELVQAICASACARFFYLINPGFIATTYEWSYEKQSFLRSLSVRCCHLGKDLHGFHSVFLNWYLVM
jgi:hypothetical protein